MKTQELFSLAGKVAVVTGGTGKKFGAEAVVALAELGAAVVITSRSAEKAEASAAEYRSRGLDVKGMALDMGSEDAIRAFAADLQSRTGRLDVLVNSASTNFIGDVETTPLAEWNRVIGINLTATMLVSRAFAPALRACRGAIINISSIYGLVSPDPAIYGDSGLNSPLVYGVSKAAVLQMTKYLACHWAPEIRVNAITPGGFFANQDPAFVEKYVQKTPLRRMAGTNDLKGAVAYLASSASQWTTGQNIIVDGGFTAW